MKKVKIVYVGAKPFALDNVAKSGAAWNGKGDIQEVTPVQAKTLLKYADQWALAEGENLDDADTTVIIETTDGQGKQILTNADELTMPTEKMSASQLVAYAKNKYGKNLKLNRGRKVLLDEVNSLDNNISVD